MCLKDFHNVGKLGYLVNLGRNMLIKTFLDFGVSVRITVSDQGSPKPGKQGSNESKQNRAKPVKTGKKTGIFIKKRTKTDETGQNRAKNGRTKPNPGKAGQNRKFWLNLGVVLRISVSDNFLFVFVFTHTNFIFW